MSPRPRLASALLAAALAFAAAPAGAVIILDDTWETYGGSEDDWSAGFDAAIELAAEPQFSAVIGFGGEYQAAGYGCTGTWIGNDEDGSAYVLTSAHCFDDVTPDEPGGWVYWTDSGTRLDEIARTLHPFYNPTDDRVGFDFAIVQLNGPIEDLGDPPTLYAGSDELSSVGTLVGYGARGTGTHGEDDKFNEGIEKAAARNMIDEVETATFDGTAGNYLTIDFDSPDGESSTMGDAQPLDDMEGILGSGDSGGSLWIETEGGWRIAGVNTSGGAVYGDTSWFARVSSQLPFILAVFPGAQYGD